MDRSQAATNGAGVVRRPRPYTVIPDSRSRVAKRVKSLSLDTITNPSTLPAWLSAGPLPARTRPALTHVLDGPPRPAHFTSKCMKSFEPPHSPPHSRPAFCSAVTRAGSRFKKPSEPQR